jgi:hypothetical protein
MEIQVNSNIMAFFCFSKRVSLTSGGSLFIKCTGVIHIRAGGKLSLYGLGYRGGAEARSGTKGFALQGESYTGPGDQSSERNGSGGGGGGCGSHGSVGGGGGGYLENGIQPQKRFKGGLVAGGEGGGRVKERTLLHLGSGGGAGFLYNGGNAYGGGGGRGGGSVIIACRVLVVDGEIDCDGTQGYPGKGRYASGGGGGSGGGVAIHCISLKLNGSIHAEGGAGGSGGDSAGKLGVLSEGGSGSPGLIGLWCQFLEGDGLMRPDGVKLEVPCTSFGENYLTAGASTRSLHSSHPENIS